MILLLVAFSLNYEMTSFLIITVDLAQHGYASNDIKQHVICYYLA